MTDEKKETPFEQAIQAWGEIALTTLQKKLDDDGETMAENQKTSLVGRKDLATKTKAFKKLEDESKLDEIKGLLKLYQTEVDNLTNRSKFAENAFMRVYQALGEAPDPKPLLEVSIDSVHSASEASRLSAENARLSELVSKHADYEHIKAKLLKLEQSSIESAHAKVRAKETEMQALMDEKERGWKLREEELKSQVDELRANSEVTQAQLQNTEGQVASEGGRIAELEFVARDLQRANGQKLELEKRNLELRQELEQAKSGTKEDDAKQEYEKRISDLEGENMVLAARIESERASLENATTEVNKKNQHLEREVGFKAEEADALRARLEKQHDYDEIKRELDVLKTIEFSNDQDAAEDEAPENLEKQLLARNKKLNDDLALLRVAKNDLQSTNDKLDQQVKKLESQLDESSKLNKKLEQDLSSMKDATPSDAMSMVSGWNWAAGSVAGGGGKVSPTSSIIAGQAPSSRGGSVGGPPPGAAAAGSSDILPIITQQRDRFRTRNAELELELKKTRQNITTLRKELEQVKQDNVDLYEKTRYANTFKKPGDGEVSVEDRYKHVYEEGLSPFQQFKGRETERVLSNMGPVERITYSFTRFVLANRLSRNLFMFYCLALHFLVLTVTFSNIHASTPSNETPIEVAPPELAPPPQ